jgi:hypothetical protein
MPSPPPLLLLFLFHIQQPIPGRGPTESAPPQHIHPTPPPGGGGGRTFKPFVSLSQVDKTYDAKSCGGGQETIDRDGCYFGCLGSGGGRETCRWVTTKGGLGPLVGDNDFAVDCDVTLGDLARDTQWTSGKDSPRVEFTIGGPGTTGKNCCGFSVCVNIRDGTLHMEAEDASGKGHTGTVYCDDSKGNRPCTHIGASISGGKALFRSTIHLRWEVRSDGHNWYYIGEATGPKGTVSNRNNPIKNPTSPGTHGKILAPFPYERYAPGNKIARDPDRIRTDSVLPVDYNGGPTVTILGKNTYGRGWWDEGGWDDGFDEGFYYDYYPGYG